MKLRRYTALAATLLLCAQAAQARPARLWSTAFQDPDSASVAALRDSIDRIWWSTIDTTTIPTADSIFQAHFDSIALFLPDTNDIKKAIKQIRKEERDSIREHKPRILETYAIPDSLYYRRMLVWTADSKFNEMHLEELDTTYNYHFNDYPFFKKDVNATYLGTIGSATLYHNYFKREQTQDAPMFTPYTGDSFTPATLKQYNAKSPYTELAYWGTPFNSTKMEEAELNLLTTQNITPALNITLGYRRLGSRGMLNNESTDHRNSFISGNYMGKKYMLHAGMIHQGIKREENGGLRDSFWIRDTVIDTKAIEVNLSDATDTLKRTTFFINHNLAISLNFLRKDRDSLAMGDGTMAFVGHYGEFTTWRKTYRDEISTGDSYGRALYNNKFYLDPTTSATTLRVSLLNNKFFIKLQPFAPDAIISKINVGIGYKLLWIKNINEGYDAGYSGMGQNLYLYAGASGMFKKYFRWEADATYYLAGSRMFDFDINGKITLSFYPVEKGIHLTGKFHTGLTTPHPFEQKIYTNHHTWENDFGKYSTTKAEATLSIPKWKLEAFAGYAIEGNMLYYDGLATIRQNPGTVNVLTAYLKEDLKLWLLHFDHRVLFQLSSNPEILPLPKWSLNLRYYVQFPVVKNVMDMQIGLNGTLYTKYYAPAYDPDLGQFYSQTDEKIGGVPYFDAFVNVQWKRACIFVKYTNCFKGWPSSDYFSAYHYIRPDKGFKFGIFWPFYLH